MTDAPIDQALNPQPRIHALTDRIHRGQGVVGARIKIVAFYPGWAHENAGAGEVLNIGRDESGPRSAEILTPTERIVNLPVIGVTQGIALDLDGRDRLAILRVCQLSVLKGRVLYQYTCESGPILYCTVYCIKSTRYYC